MMTEKYPEDTSDWRVMMRQMELIGFSSPRKLRLFAVACCRRIWRLMDDERLTAAVEVAERFADGQSTISALSRAARMAHECPRRKGRNAAYSATSGDAWAAAHNAGHYADGGSKIGNIEQVEMFLCIFGNVVYPQSINPDWLTWNDGTVRKLAQTIYDDRRFDLLPILADALEESGCGNDDILTHCRGPGPHVRGCWVVDLLLGKE